MSFQNLLGNDAIKGYLQKALEQKKLSHTLIFHGIEGVGKFLFAKELAKRLLYPTSDSKSFSKSIDPSIEKKIEEENFSDLSILRPEGKIGMHSMESIKKLLDKASLSAYEAEAKVFIILDAERMLASSSNALLKVLEEPDKGNYFILITHKIDEILSTIKSRSFCCSFSPLPEETIVEYLINSKGVKEAEARRVAKFSQGSLGKALRYSEEKSFFEKGALLEKIFQIQPFNYVELSEALDKLDKIFSKEKENRDRRESREKENGEKENKEENSDSYKDVESLFSYIEMWYRDLQVYKSTKETKRLFFEGLKGEIQRVDFEKIPSMERVFEVLEAAKSAYIRNIKLKSCLEMVFLELSE